MYDNRYDMTGMTQELAFGCVHCNIGLYLLKHLQCRVFNFYAETMGKLLVVGLDINRCIIYYHGIHV